MENENKDLQGGTEAEMQEKVRQDVSAKIAEAAAEVQDDILDAAERVAVDNEAEPVTEDAFADAAEIVEEGELPEDWEPSEEDFAAEEEAEEVVVKEPKRITMTLGSLVWSLIGTALAGALILLLGLQIPGWVENMPEGKKVISVDGTAITDQDMSYYLYRAAVEYFEENGGTLTKPTEVDWSADAGDGKTAEEIVREKAIDAAVSEALLMNAGKKSGMEWNEKENYKNAWTQQEQMLSVYSPELVDLHIKRQGISSEKQYIRKVVQMQHMNAVLADMEENPSNYYPEDSSVLDPYTATDSATVKHILIKTADSIDAEETPEGETPASAEDKRALAEDLLARIQNGEDFDTLLAEYNEDTAEPADGYTFGPGEMMPAFEEASFALKLNEVSGIVETDYGYHIIKRLPGQNELEGYWKDQAKIRIKEKAIAKMSVAEILQGIEDSSKAFNELYEKEVGSVG